MDLNSQVMAPVVETTGARAVIAYVVGGIAGTAIAPPVLVSVFGL